MGSSQREMTRAAAVPWEYGIPRPAYQLRQTQHNYVWKGEAIGAKFALPAPGFSQLALEDQG